MINYTLNSARNRMAMMYVQINVVRLLMKGRLKLSSRFQ